MTTKKQQLNIYEKYLYLETALHVVIKLGRREKFRFLQRKFETSDITHISEKLKVFFSLTNYAQVLQSKLTVTDIHFEKHVNVSHVTKIRRFRSPVLQSLSVSTRLLEAE